MSEKITIAEQVFAMEEVVQNHHSYINLVRRLVAKSERPEEILKETESRLPYMEAALNTLKWVQLNREAIINAHKALAK